MHLSVIVPTCNRNDLLKQCLGQLQPHVQHLSLSEYEIIVTDDSKTNKARKLIEQEFNWVNCVEGPKQGPAANRNNGAKHAKGDWLVFVDDDCVPSKNLLNAYITATKKFSGIKVFEGFTSADRKKRSFTEESPINENGGFLWSCNFMIAKDLFKQMNGFDELFPYAAMEDVDLHYRLKQAKKRTEFIKEASVIHPWREQKRMIAASRKRFQSVLFFLNKHPEMKKQFNFFYFFRASYNNIRILFRHCLEYKFRGFGKQLLFSFLQLYFALLMLFDIPFKNKNHHSFFKGNNTFN
jgi:GT2 family glycosyltransferase